VQKPDDNTIGLSLAISVNRRHVQHFQSTSRIRASIFFSVWHIAY